jgi:hypothetical protein
MFFIMEHELYTVYVFHLKNGWRFLYPKNQNLVVGSVSELMKEFQYINTLFGDDFQAVELLHTYQNVLPYNINGLVLHHMNVYGIEQVRGGKYTKVFLTTEEKEEISKSIKYFSDGLFEECDKTARYHNYVVEYGSFDESQLHVEQDRIAKILTQFNNIKARWAETNIVSEYDLGEIQWLKQICDISNVHFKNIEARYNSIMKNITNVYNFYKNNIENAEEQIASIRKLHPHMETAIWFYCPNTFFDNIVIHKNSFRYYREYLPYVISVVELMFYTIHNRTVELEFDIKCLNQEENTEKFCTITNLLKSAEVSKL